MCTRHNSVLERRRSAMDLLSKDEPLINLNGFDSSEEADDLLSEESLHPHHQRRLNNSKHASINTTSNRQHRLSSGSKVYLTEISPVRKDQSMERHNSAIVSAVERTMKNYADGVLRVLEGMSGRLSQLELTTQDLEHSVASLKVSVDESHEHTGGNFKILNERVMEMHRGVQILRDKQDIFEAHAQLAKLQTSKALAEKESAQGLSVNSSAESAGAVKGHQQQELALQVQPQQSLPQPIVSQPQHVLAQQYQAPSLQSQQLVPTQHKQQELSGQAVQQSSNVQNPSEQVQYQSTPQQMHVQTPSEQVQYQSTPQQMHVQQLLPSQQPPLQVQQPLEQVRYLPALPQMQMQQPIPQQGPGQQPLQVTQHSVPTQQQSEQAHFQSAPQQRQIQQMPPQQASVQSEQAHYQSAPQQRQIPLQQASVQQPIQVQQGMVTQQPPQQMQSHSSGRLQGSFQYYGQPNESQSYSSAAPGMPTFVQGGYVTETARDSTNYAPNQRPVSLFSTHQSPQMPPIQTYHQQMAVTPPPQVTQPPHDPNAGTNPMTWNRQASLGTSGAAPRLLTAQPVRAEHTSSEVNGVIEKVVAMGFTRDQVQSVIRRLTERNQAVDMNVVLDILMNGGRGNQGRFGR